MKSNVLNLNSSISGNYKVSVIKKNGEEYFPFGEDTKNNLILDTFFDSILRDGYRYTPQAFVQSCMIGGGAGSDTPTQRTQTGLQGSQIYISHLGNVFTANVSGGSLVLSRDFLFTTNSTLNPIVCREAVVGCFGSSGSSLSGMDITVSRFVFPFDVVVNNGEQLKITYTLNIALQHLTNNIPVILSSNDLNISGIIRLGSNDVGIRSNDPSGGTTNIVQTPGPLYHSRNWKTDNTNSYFVSTTTTTTIGVNLHIFNRINGYDQIGFFDTSHVASLTTYPTARPAYTPSGPVGSFQAVNYLKNDSGASIDLDYYFSSHTANRTVGGIYLWYNTNSVSYAATYLKFTENDFVTNRSLTIPAGQPVGFKIRWSFSR